MSSNLFYCQPPHRKLGRVCQILAGEEEGLVRRGRHEAGLDRQTGQARNVTLHKHSHSCMAMGWQQHNWRRSWNKLQKNKHHSWAIIDLTTGWRGFITSVRATPRVKVMSQKGGLLQRGDLKCQRRKASHHLWTLMCFSARLLWKCVIGENVLILKSRTADCFSGDA